MCEGINLGMVTELTCLVGVLMPGNFDLSVQLDIEMCNGKENSLVIYSLQEIKCYVSNIS